MKKCCHFNFRILAILGLVISFTGCANKMIDYEVENNWTNLLDRNNIDYHSFSDAAKSAIYGMRWDSDSDFVNLVEVSRELSDIQGASSMEVEAIAKAGVEDSFIIADVSMAYANASAISIAVDNYCEQCYRLGNEVKKGTYSFKISSRVSSGTVKYSGKSNDLKKYLNKFSHSEARNGYCYIEVNEYNKPVSVFWSQTQFDKEQINNMSSFNLMDIEDIQNGSPVIGAYPGTFKLNNFSIYRTALNTSVSNKFTAPIYIEYDDVEDTIDDMTTAFADDIFSAISEDEIDDAEENGNITSSSEKMTPYELESRISTDNSNAKLAYTNAATYITKSEVNGYQVADGWYIADLNNNGNTTRDCKYDGTDIDKALTELMGSESAGYVCVHIKNSMIDKSYYCQKNVFPYLSLDSMPESLECNSEYIIGSYPNPSTPAEKVNFTVNNAAINNSVMTDKKSTQQNNDSMAIISNPFDGLEVQFDGASPYLTASVNTSGCSEDVKKYVTFSVTDVPLRKGDNVTVTASWDDNALSGTGINFSTNSKDYVVDNASYYLDSLNGIDLSELNQLMDDFVEAEANKCVNDYEIFMKSCKNAAWYHGEQYTIGYSPIVTGIESINVVKKYLLSMKQPSSLNNDKVFNKYVCIYEVNYKTYREATGENASGTATIAVFMENIVMNTDGTLLYNSSEPLASKLLYYKAEDTISIIESNYIVAEKAQYNVIQIN